jgi:hypothetical protein
VAWVRERNILTERPQLIRKISVNFLRIQSAKWSAQQIPNGRILCILDWSRYFFFQVATELYSRGSVDTFQTHYFSENSVAPGIELGPLDL